MLVRSGIGTTRHKLHSQDSCVALSEWTQVECAAVVNALFYSVAKEGIVIHVLLI